MNYIMNYILKSDELKSFLGGEINCNNFISRY